MNTIRTIATEIRTAVISMGKSRPALKTTVRHSPAFRPLPKCPHCSEYHAPMSRFACAASFVA